MRIGYIGLGDIGRGMAENLARAGLDLVVHDIRPEAMLPLVELGAARAGTAAEVITGADLVHICVVDAEQVRELVDVAAAHGHRGQIVVVHSTVPPETAQSCAAVAAAVGIELLDAPISGGRDGARTGTLTIMVGGPVEAFARVLPVLSFMGSTVRHVGPVGSGEAVKLANNVMSMGNRLLYLEALRLAESYGVAEELMNEVVSTSTGASWAQSNIWFLDEHAVLHTEAGSPGHPERFAKDLRYAAALARDRDLPMPITELCAQRAPEEFRARWAQGRKPARQRTP